MRLRRGGADIGRAPALPARASAIESNLGPELRSMTRALGETRRFPVRFRRFLHFLERPGASTAALRQPLPRRESSAPRRTPKSQRENEMVLGQSLRRMRIAGGLLAPVIAALLPAVPASAQAISSNPGIAPIAAKPYGKTYGQWAVAYWQWAMSIPIATSPWANDPTGAFAAIGQQGPVWFLGGSLGDSFTRSVTIPSNKAIFLPVHPWIFGATVFDCAPSVPEVSCDVPSLRAAAATAAQSVDIIEVAIDGRMVSNAAG